jgi:hypothetical protein
MSGQEKVWRWSSVMRLRNIMTRNTLRNCWLGVCGVSLLSAACSGPAPATGAAPAPGAAAAAPALSDEQISDAYIYLLGRLLVLRQQQADFAEGFKWNTLVHRKPGDVQWPNPNLDVAYSEGWVAVDEKSCLIVTVPRITGRYYTVQFLNGWGETVANINERAFPQHPHGDFAVCLKGGQAEVPATAQRVEVPVKYLRVLSRVELGRDWDEAVALQRQVAVRATGEPALPTVPRTIMFDIEALPGVEAFDSAVLALDSEADINPGMEPLQAASRAIATAIQDPAERQRVDQVIRTKAFEAIRKATPTLADGTVRNGWALASTMGVYGSNYLLRTIVNYGGIWANTFDEVVYFKGFVGPDGAPLSGDHVYTLTFPKDALPIQYATYFWSVIAVDAVHRRVLPNPTKRYLVNKESKLEYGKDGSLTLYFADARPEGAPDGNWLPTPRGTRYSLTFRFYRARGPVADRTYFPPALVMQDRVRESE